MCIICVLIDKDKLTAREAFNALMEAEIPEGHLDEVTNKIADIEPVPEEDDEDEGPQWVTKTEYNVKKASSINGLNKLFPWLRLMVQVCHISSADDTSAKNADAPPLKTG